MFSFMNIHITICVFYSVKFKSAVNIFLIFLYFSFSSFYLEMRSWQEVIFVKTMLIILNGNLVKYNLQSCSLVKRLHIELSQQNQDTKHCLCLCYLVMNVFYTCKVL